MSLFRPYSISEARQAIREQKEVRLLCPHCSGSVYVALSYPYTALKRQKAIQTAVDEHRRICSAAPAEAERVYKIEYQRS